MEISPDTLQFKGPFAQPSTEYIVLKNPTSEVLAFKVKTTAPRLYCVRPNASVVKPGEELRVSIILQGLEEEPAVDFACRDKFLVVTLPCPYDLDESSVSTIWNKLESEFKAQSKSKKIRVEYVTEAPAAIAAVTPAAVASAYSSEKAEGSTLKATAAGHQKELAESDAKIAQLSEKLTTSKTTAPGASAGAAVATEELPQGALWIGIISLLLMALVLVFTVVY